MAAALPWFLFAHVLSALWFAAGVLTAPVVLARTRRAGSLAERVFGLRLAWRLVAGFSIPGAVVSGLLGVHLIETRGYSWQAGWVHVSLWIWGVVLLATALLLAPWLHGALREAEASLEAGLPSEKLKRQTAAGWPGWIAGFDALAAVVLTLLMMLRPF